MTNFETLLLQSGSPDLICAYIEEHEKSLSSDFMRNFEIYYQKAEKKLKDAIHFDPFTMEVAEFLEVYGGNILSTTIKSRIRNCIRDYVLRNYDHVYTPTVQHMLKIKKHELIELRKFGPKSVKQLELVLDKAGLKLQD